MGAAIPVLSLIPSLVVPQRYTQPLFDQHGVDKLGGVIRTIIDFNFQAQGPGGACLCTVVG